MIKEERVNVAHYTYTQTHTHMYIHDPLLYRKQTKNPFGQTQSKLVPGTTSTHLGTLGLSPSPLPFPSPKSAARNDGTSNQSKLYCFTTQSTQSPIHDRHTR